MVYNLNYKKNTANIAYGWGKTPRLEIRTGGFLLMEITDIRVRKINKDGKMKAVVSVTFDNEFVVHDIKVIEGDKGRFIAMPSRKTLDGEFRDIAHPINSETRDRIQKTVLEKYEMVLLSEDDATEDEVAVFEE